MKKTVGLIGWPVAHSFSPLMHNAAFAALNLDWQYVLLPTPDDQLATVIDRIRSGELSGANVTLPHKSAVMPLLDDLDPLAKSIGAVNTIVVRKQRLIGYNTDALGFQRALGRTGVEVKDRSCAVLGAGGSARAVVRALDLLGARATVYARDVVKAQAWIAAERVYAFSNLSNIDQETVLIVNSTPLGMTPQVDASPWPDQLGFPPNALVFDLVYNPAQTRLMDQALRSGVRSINGLTMLIDQGAAAFEMWTGRAAPIEVMREALGEHSLNG
jgi:shikimate dehydrogenase